VWPCLHGHKLTVFSPSSSHPSPRLSSFPPYLQNTMVNQVDLEGAGNATFGGDEPERLEAFKMMASVAQAHGSLYVVQLSHAGRQVGKHINPNPVSASDVQLQDGKMGQCYGKPEPLSIEGIKEVVNSFASAAEYAYKTGADGVQLHASHGYLLARRSLSTLKRREERKKECL